MEEVFRDWDHRITMTIANSGVPYDSIEDVKGEIYLSMIRRDICGKYDPTRAKCFSTYLYKVVHSLIGNHFRDYQRKKHIPDDKLVFFQSFFEDSFLFSCDTLIYDNLKDIEREDFIEKVLTELALPENKRVIRSASGASMLLKDAVYLMMQGHSMKDIASSIGVRSEAIKKSLSSLKNTTWLVEYNKLAEAN